MSNIFSKYRILLSGMIFLILAFLSLPVLAGENKVSNTAIKPAQKKSIKVPFTYQITPRLTLASLKANKLLDVVSVTSSVDNEAWFIQFSDEKIVEILQSSLIGKLGEDGIAQYFTDLKLAMQDAILASSADTPSLRNSFAESLQSRAREIYDIVSVGVIGLNEDLLQTSYELMSSHSTDVMIDAMLMFEQLDGTIQEAFEAGATDLQTVVVETFSDGSYIETYTYDDGSWDAYFYESDGTNVGHRTSAPDQDMDGKPDSSDSDDDNDGRDDDSFMEWVDDIWGSFCTWCGHRRFTDNPVEVVMPYILNAAFDQATRDQLQLLVNQYSAGVITQAQFTEMANAYFASKISASTILNGKLKINVIRSVY